MKLAWNAIVRNERAVIDRCVRSLLPHIDCAIVVDTGSTDGTQERLKELFQAAGKPIEITPAPFVNFEQARNEALRCARLSRLEWDYLLLADADMELKVHKPNWINGAKGLSYDVRQTAGTLGYYNRRLVSHDATGWYVGVTHEYLDIPTDGVLDGAEFVDHADGSNRPEKFQRDIDLLEEALRTEQRPGIVQRYTFYLAQSYFDAGNWEKAAENYKKRVRLGGFDEEIWNAQLHYAHCVGNLGNNAKFVWEMLQAYKMRPQRAEVLYDLAKYFRERGDNHASLLFSEAGMQIPHAKDDLLFVNDWVYKSGLKEEFAICAYYDPRRRESGAAVCDELALKGSEQARSNIYWYLRSLAEWVPSFKPTQVDFPPPEGYVATNPSIIEDDGRVTMLLRTVNYTITPEGQYAILGADGNYSGSNPINTRNYLVRYTHGMTVYHAQELGMPSNWPKTEFELVRGFEDSRLFKWNGELWTLSTVRELTPHGWCEQVLAPINETGDYGQYWEVIRPKERRHEKNWMPWVKNGRLDFVYRLGSILDAGGKLVRQHDTGLEVGHISGGSQVIEADGVYIALVHEARMIPGRPNRYYQHRFVAFEPSGAVLKISQPFYFHDRQIEFAAGLAYFPENHQLVVSYGVRDCEAWLAKMDVSEVLDFIDGG